MVNNTKKVSQVTLEYALLAVAVGLSAAMFLHKFDTVKDIFKNHFKDTTDVIATYNVPPISTVSAGSTALVKQFNTAASADDSQAEALKAFNKWQQAALNPVVGQYRGEVYAFAKAAIEQMVANGEISPLVGQYAMSSVTGYLGCPASGCPVSGGTDLVGKSMWVWNNMSTIVNQAEQDAAKNAADQTGDGNKS